MSELCHICDLFRTALFGPTNNNEDHLDNGMGTDLPRPMQAGAADAPATMGVRTRNRPGPSLTANSKTTKPAPQLPAGSAATATPSLASEGAAPRGSGETAPGAGSEVASSVGPAAATAAKPVPKTKFSKRAPRGLKAAPAYMSFDDVDVEDDDSDGELFVGGEFDSRDNRRGSGARSPGSIAAQEASAYSVNAPSVYRAPSLVPPTVAAPAAPTVSSPVAGDALAGDRAIAAAAASLEERHVSSGGVVAPAEHETEKTQEARYQEENMLSHQAVAGDSSVELFSSGVGAKESVAGLRLGGDRITSIPRNASTLESARPHGQSESFHGYKGYPGYEPETPVAHVLAQPGYSHAADGLTINPGADVPDPRQKHGVAAGPTPSSVRYPSREEDGSDMVSGVTPAGKHEPPQYEDQGLDIDDDDGGFEQEQQHSLQQHRQHRQQPPSISPSGTTSMEMATGLRPPEPRSRAQAQVQVQVTTRNQRDGGVGVGDGPIAGTAISMSGSGRPPASSARGGAYGSEAGDNSSSYGGGGVHAVASPTHSQANSMASSFRNIQQQRSEDGMGSVLGTIAGTEESVNEDLQWKRSALKKFHKVMVKGEGLRVVKHNRSGGSQMRIIRYDPEMKALVWNSKRYMKKAGSANVPIVSIKRVGREGNTVSVTAAGRGTIGFEPQRIRDAKILAEALRALVDKEERSAMWRG